MMDYKWSSYPAYAYRRKGFGWLKTDLILSFFSGPDPVKAYREKCKRMLKKKRVSGRISGTG